MNGYQKYKELKKIITFLISTSIIVGILLSFTFIRWETAEAADSGWWVDANWDYSKRIAINHSQVDAALTNFPILVHITGDTDLGSHAQDNGDDILFTMDGDNETKLNHEIEIWNDDGTYVNASIWVNITSLSSSVDTNIWMYYGNAGAMLGQDEVLVSITSQTVPEDNLKVAWYSLIYDTPRFIVDLSEYTSATQVAVPDSYVYQFLFFSGVRSLTSVEIYLYYGNVVQQIPVVIVTQGVYSFGDIDEGILIIVPNPSVTDCSWILNWLHKSDFIMS